MIQNLLSRLEQTSKSSCYRVRSFLSHFHRYRRLRHRTGTSSDGFLPVSYRVGELVCQSEGGNIDRGTVRVGLAHGEPLRRRYSSDLITVWNFAMRTAVLMMVAYALSHLKAMLDQVSELASRIFLLDCPMAALFQSRRASNGARIQFRAHDFRVH
jgi:hypothetical protein